VYVNLRSWLNKAGPHAAVGIVALVATRGIALGDEPLPAGSGAPAASAAPAPSPSAPAAPAAGDLDRERALALYDRSAVHYRAGEFREAASLLKQAWVLAKEPVLLYNLARACENAGYLQCAAESYDEYLRIESKLEDEAGLRRRLRVLHAQIDERERAARPQAAPWIIAGIGLLGMGAGLGTGLLAASRHNEAETERVHERAFELQREAEALALASTVTWVAGGAVHAGGVIWGIVDLSTLRPARDGVADIAFEPGSVRLRLSF
jgi:tetratricopeptide (TPR) repeat protein